MEQLPLRKAKKENLVAVVLQKDMLLVLIAIFFVYMNLFNSLTILPLYVLDTGGTDFEVGLLSTILTLSAVFLRMLIGSKADNWGRKLPLLIGSFVFGSSSLMIWLLPSLFWQVLTRMYLAIGMATFLSTGSLVVSDLTPIKYRGSVMGIYRLVTVIAFMLGPSLSLGLINNYGYNTYFIYNALICFFSFGVLWFIPEGRQSKSENRNSLFSNIQLLWENSSLVKAYLGIAIIASCYSVLITYISIFAQRYLGIDNSGLFFTLFAGVGCLAGILGGVASDRFGRSRIVWPTSSALGAGLVAIAFLPQLGSWSLYIGAVLAGIGYFGSLPIFIAWIVDEADVKIAATALAFQENAIDGSFALSSFLFGLFTLYANYSLIYLVWGLLSAAIPLYMLRISK